MPHVMSRSSHSILLFLVLLMGLSLLCGCHSGTVYSHYEPVPLEGWRNDDTIRFQLGPVMEGGTFHDELALRTTSAYPYTHLSLVVRRQVLPDGNLYTDSITIPLTDSQGSSTGVGATLRHHVLPLSLIRLDSAQHLSVSIHHNMKKEVLPGISDLGMTITKR